MSTCAAVWCDRDAIARGLCKRCYDRYRRGISPISPTKRHAVAEDKARLRDEITLRREAGQRIADIAAAVGLTHLPRVGGCASGACGSGHEKMRELRSCGGRGRETTSTSL